MTALKNYVPGLEGWIEGENQGLRRSAHGMNTLRGVLAVDAAQREAEMAQMLTPLRAALMSAQTQKALRPENPLSKLNPKDFTPESFAQYAATGNPTMLRPREKVVTDNLGNRIVYRGEYSTTPQGEAPLSMRPGEPERIGLQGDANAIARAQAGISGERLYQDTGVRMPVPGAPGAPRGALGAPLPRSGALGGALPAPGAAPVAAPRPATAGLSQEQQPAPESTGFPIPPGLSPRQQREYRAALAKELPQAEAATRDLISQSDTFEQEVDELLNLPEGKLESALGASGTVYGLFAGESRAIRNRIDQLKARSFSSTITNLRNASKTGGLVGNMSDAEGARFEVMQGNLDKYTDVVSFKQNLKQLKLYAQRTRQEAQQGFKNAYGATIESTGEKYVTPIFPLAPEDNKTLFEKADEILRGR